MYFGEGQSYFHRLKVTDHFTFCPPQLFTGLDQRLQNDDQNQIGYIDNRTSLNHCLRLKYCDVGQYKSQTHC